MPKATTIFVGGGTPSMLPGEALAEVIATVPTVDADGMPTEVTVECNPDDVDEELLRTYRDVGVNRISVGVQSTHSHVLAELGRTHDRGNVDRSIEAIKAVGFDSFNLDIIFGAVGESLTDWESTLEAILEHAPPHVSAYGLTVEPGTALANNPLRLPLDDDQADKYELAEDKLSRSGLQNYEISNWAIPGHECRHNQLYWQQHDYRGFGSAAHSHASGRRWWNVRTPERYIDAVKIGATTEAAGETLDAATRRFERLELELRTRDGVPVEALDGEALPGLVEQVVTDSGPRWVLTTAGRLIANDVSTLLIV